MLLQNVQCIRTEFPRGRAVALGPITNNFFHDVAAVQVLLHFLVIAGHIVGIGVAPAVIAQFMPLRVHLTHHIRIFVHGKTRDKKRRVNSMFSEHAQNAGHAALRAISPLGQNDWPFSIFRVPAAPQAFSVHIERQQYRHLLHMFPSFQVKYTYGSSCVFAKIRARFCL